MKTAVVDTGPLVVANLRSPQAGPECVLACVNALEEIQKSGRIVLDASMLIFQEYSSHCSFAGQPGVGDAFFKWVFDHRYNDDRCERVTITPIAETHRRFEEMPKDAELRSFDRSDQKFVAVALRSKNSPEVLVAVDSDWWDHRVPLSRNGVKLTFLCPEYFAGPKKVKRKAPVK